MTALPPQPQQSPQPHLRPHRSLSPLTLIIPYLLSFFAPPEIGLIISLTLSIPVHLQIHKAQSPDLKDYLYTKHRMYTTTWFLAGIAALLYFQDSELAFLLGISFWVFQFYVLSILADASPKPDLAASNKLIQTASGLLLFISAVSGFLDPVSRWGYLVAINCLLVVFAETTLYQIRLTLPVFDKLIVIAVCFSTAANIIFALNGDPSKYFGVLILFAVPVAICISAQLRWSLRQQ